MPRNYSKKINKLSEFAIETIIRMILENYKPKFISEQVWCSRQSVYYYKNILDGRTNTKT